MKPIVTRFYAVLVALTFVGLGMLLWMVRSGGTDEKDQGEFVGDLDEDRPGRVRP